MDDNLFALIRRSISDESHVFLETGDGRTITYGEMLTTSAKFAHALRQWGVKPGDRVAVQVVKSPEAVMLYLACLRFGCVYLPLNTGYTDTELDYFFRDAEPTLIVCDTRRLANIERTGAAAGATHVTTLDADGAGQLSQAAAALPATFDDTMQRMDDPAAILYTSGTTGRSKGAVLTHGNLSSNAAALVHCWRFSRDDYLLHALPIFHTHGLFVAINVTLLSGATMVFLPGFDLDQVIRTLARASVMMGVPTFYTRLLSAPGFDRNLVRHMRLFVSGSAPLSAQTHKEFRERTGHEIIERYGMTETGMIASNPYEGERRPGAVGLPLPGVEVRISDPKTGAPRPQGTVGAIEIRGPNVFKGYWRMPEKTRAEFRADGYFISGDLGFFDADGYLHISGRDKDLIISGGYNVYPAEVEAEVNAIKGIMESAVIGLPHPDFGEGVTAIVTLRPHCTIDEADIRQALATRLAKYKVPKKVIVTDRLPRNAMGKVQKAVLRDRFAST